LLYRIADADGLISSEGVLLPGEVVDLHSTSWLFNSKIYVSLRLVNYSWSRWTKIFTRSSPYPTTEKLIDVTLTSLELTHYYQYTTVEGIEGQQRAAGAGAGAGTMMKEFAIPTLGLNLGMREHFIRISCPLLISNRTGLSLDMCESNSTEFFLPQCSRSSVEMLVSTDTESESNSSLYPDKKSSSSGGKGAFLDVATPMRPSRNNDSGGSGSSDCKRFNTLITPPLTTSTTSAKLTESYAGDNSNRNDRGNSTNININNHSNSNSTSNKVVSLIIHLPYDHLCEVELTVSAHWTLYDVFSRINQKLAVNPTNQRASKYLFFPWDEGKLGPRKVAHSPIVELDTFGRHQRGASGDSVSMNGDNSSSQGNRGGGGGLIGGLKAATGITGISSGSGGGGTTGIAASRGRGRGHGFDDDSGSDDDDNDEETSSRSNRDSHSSPASHRPNAPAAHAHTSTLTSTPSPSTATTSANLLSSARVYAAQYAPITDSYLNHKITPNKSTSVASAAPTSASTSASAVASALAGVTVPPTMIFNMVATCSNAPLSMVSCTLPFSFIDIILFKCAAIDFYLVAYN
jgi:hypothetical protein